MPWLCKLSALSAASIVRVQRGASASCASCSVVLRCVMLLCVVGSIPCEQPVVWYVEYLIVLLLCSDVHYMMQHPCVKSK